MVTGELKSKIDSLWEIFWTGGLTNPLDVIEQMTYLMFIHDLDESDNTHAKEAAMLGLPYKSIFAGEVQVGERTVDGAQLKWSVFHDFPAGKMYSTMQEMVFPFIKNLHGDKDSAYAKYMGDAIFKVPTPLMLDKIVTAMDGMYEQAAQLSNTDIRGDIYEYLLSKLATAGVNGQFRTPRHIIRMMVDLMQPRADDVICDPACGTAGFLVAAGEYLRENRKQEVFFDRKNKDHYMNHMFHGFDMDRTMLRIGAMNMMLHGVDNPFIEYRDSLSDQNPDKDKYSLILANPPFKGSLDYDIVSTDLLKLCKTKKTELLFLALFLRMLKVGGRCACIVPDGVLFGSSTAHKAIRKEIIENNRLEAVISMPSGVFKPYAGVSTAILIFTKTGHGGTDNVWFYDMKADGFSLDDKRSPTTENDIPDIIARFHNREAEATRERTEQSFFVPKEEIAGNDYDLSINKYKKTEYVPVEYVRRNISSFFSWLEEEDYILKSPMRRIHKIKTKQPVKDTISDEAIERLRDNCKCARDLAMIDLLYSTGIRVGELVNLNISEIDFEARECVVFGKGDKERRVYFDAKAKLHLQDYLRSRTDANPALFVTLDAPFDRLKISGVEIRLRELGRELNLDKIHPHKFRRTMATRAIDKGMPIEQVQKILGHSQIGTTMQYAIVNQNNVKTSHQKFIA